LNTRLLKRTVAFLVSILVLLLVAFFILRAVFPSEMLRELAVARMEEATGLEISVADARVSFVHWRIGVKVSGVEVSQLAGQQYTKLATVPEIGVVVALRPLLKKEIVMEQVYVERPEISILLAERPDVSADTIELGTREIPAAAGRIPLLMSFALPRTVIRGANVEIRDPRSGALVRAARLDSRSRVRAERGGEILFSEGSFSCREVSFVLGEELPFPVAPLKVEGSWKIGVNSAERILDLETVLLRAAGLPIAMSGRVSLAEERPELDIQVKLDGAAVDALLEFVPKEALDRAPDLKLGGEVVASADIKGRLPSPDYSGDFELVGGSGSVSGLRLRDVVARGRFDKNIATLEEFNVSLGSSIVEGSATVTIHEPRRATFASSGTLSLGELAALLPLPEGSKLKKGEVSFEAKGDGLLEELASDPLSIALEGEASASTVEIELTESSPPVFIDKAHLDFSGRRVRIAGTTARIGSSVFDIDGTIEDLKERSVRLEVQSPHVNLEELLEPLAKGRASVDGAEGTPVVPAVALVGVPATGSATLEVELLTYEYFRGQDLRAELVFGGDSIVVSGITMKTLGGDCSGRGQLLFPKEGTPTYKGSFSAEEIELADLLISFTPVKELLKGQTFFEIDFEGEVGQELPPLSSVVATGKVKTAKASAIASPLVAAVATWTGLERKGEYPLKDFATSFLVENERLVVPRCLLADENSAWEFSGSTGFDGTLEHRVSVTFSEEYSEKVASLRGLERLLKDNEGRVVLDFTVGGTVRKPSLKWDGARMENRAKEYLAEKLRQELEKGGQKTQELREELKGDLEGKVEKLKKEAAEKGQKLLDDLFKKKEKKD
jgi:hypothetical protein